MNQKTIEAENYAIECGTYDDQNAIFVRLKEVTHSMLIPEVTLSHDNKSKK